MHSFAQRVEFCWEHLWDRKHGVTSVIRDDIRELLPVAGRRALMCWGYWEAPVLLACSLARTHRGPRASCQQPAKQAEPSRAAMRGCWPASALGAPVGCSKQDLNCSQYANCLQNQAFGNAGGGSVCWGVELGAKISVSVGGGR